MSPNSILWSIPPKANNLPLCDVHIVKSLPCCVCNTVPCVVSSLISHRRHIVTSYDAEMICFLSSRREMADSHSVCPSNLRSSSPAVASHSHMVLSSDPDINNLQSGLYATQLTSPSCPLKVCRKVLDQENRCRFLRYLMCMQFHCGQARGSMQPATNDRWPKETRSQSESRHSTRARFRHPRRKHIHVSRHPKSKRPNERLLLEMTCLLSPTKTYSNEPSFPHPMQKTVYFHLRKMSLNTHS